MAANRLLDDVFTQDDLLEMAATIEGHPDNVAAAVHGGMRLVVMGRQSDVHRSGSRPGGPAGGSVHPGPADRTVDARRVLPDEISVADACTI